MGDTTTNEVIFIGVQKALCKSLQLLKYFQEQSIIFSEVRYTQRWC